MALEIHPLCLGEGNADMSWAVWQHEPGTKVLTPVSSFLILGGPEAILVDAGMSQEAADAIGSTIKPEHRLDAQLAKHDLEMGDIGIAVFTHLHIDHAGLADKLTGARLVVQRRELEYAAAPLPPEWIYDQADIIKFVGPLRERLELIDGDLEIADGVRAVFTGGHSPGHQMVYVDVPSGQAVVVGDNVYLVDPGLTQRIQPGYVYSSAETHAAIDRIRRDAVHALPAHDPTIYDRYADGVR